MFSVLRLNYQQAYVCIPYYYCVVNADGTPVTDVHSIKKTLGKI